MWKTTWGPAAHILDVQRGTSGSLCQPWRPCPRDIDPTQGEELASGGGTKHPILLVPWLCLDHCGVLRMLVIVTPYLRDCLCTSLKYSSDPVVSGPTLDGSSPPLPADWFQKSSMGSPGNPLSRGERYQGVQGWMTSPKR